MIIIIEGLDGTGKSTVAEIICKYLKKNNKKHYLYKGRPDWFNKKYDWLDYRTWAYTNYLTCLDFYYQYLKNNNINLINDRSYISEYVYGKTKRKYFSDWIDDVEDKIKNDAILIYIYSSLEICIRRIKNRDFDKDISDVLAENYRLFEERFNLSKLNKIMINNDKSIEDLSMNIINFLRKNI